MHQTGYVTNDVVCYLTHKESLNNVLKGIVSTDEKEVNFHSYNQWNCLYRDRITDHDIIASGLVSVSQISRSGDDGNNSTIM